MRRQTLILVFLAATISAATGWAEDSALELFEQRIMPIFRSPKPSSCVQCHLTSVDLKDYIRPSHEETFLSLRDQGLIDVESPGESKILKLIRMGDEDRDELAKRIHAKTRQAELEAFAAWVAACCRDKALLDRPPLSASDVAKPEKPVEVIRHARKDRILDSFVRNVWSSRMRCFPCHTPDEIDASNPKHAKPMQTHRKFVKQYGARMNLFKKTPEATMKSLIASSRKSSSKQLPLLNFAQPANSLLLLKPTSKVPAKNDEGKFEKPSSLLPVSHMGGLKMHVDDVSYKSVLGWIEDLAKVRQGGYADENQLPPDNWYPTKHVLRLKDAPQEWPAGSRVQLFVHAQRESSDGWNDNAIAFTQGIVTPRHFVNGSLVMLKHSDDANWNSEAETLAPGNYLIKAYLDSNHKIETDPGVFLQAEDFQGQLAVTAHIIPNWKIYSITQQRGGPKKSKIKVDVDGTFRLGEFQPSPSPAIKNYEYYSVPVEEPALNEKNDRNQP